MYRYVGPHSSIRFQLRCPKNFVFRFVAPKISEPINLVSQFTARYIGKENLDPEYAFQRITLLIIQSINIYLFVNPISYFSIHYGVVRVSFFRYTTSKKANN